MHYLKFVHIASVVFVAGLPIGPSFSARADDKPSDLPGRVSQLQDRSQTTPPTGKTVHRPGDAVVTGFSGTRRQQLTPGVNPLDKTFIDLDGPSVRVLDLSNPGAPPLGQIMPAPSLFTVTARQIGQVFAVAQDDATPPNIYVGATSGYGLPIVAAQPDRDGSLRRLHRGEVGARFMPGLFGLPAAGGGPGSIWRVDGRTGAVSLFANIPNSGAGLGDIAYDGAHRQFFVSDRTSGMIHRVGPDGTLRESYDHGTTGRGIVGLVPVPDRPERRLNIQSPAFDPGNPQSWNFPPPARRTFGLAIFKNRLFYAIAAGPQVWSVVLSADGSFGTSATWELDTPVGSRSTEIASMLFDDAGQIYLAERGAPTGAYDFEVLASPGVARVLRYRLRQPNDPPGPGRWAPVPDEYAVGLRPDHRNASGGLARGYHYTPNNTFGACSGTLWATGDHLRAIGDPVLARQLASSGPLALNGLQGAAIELPRPNNVPPRASLFVRYDDRVDEAAAREQSGHVGGIAIWQSCGAPPPRIVLTCPIGFNWNGFTRLCEPLVTAAACPPGQRWDGRGCVAIVCWGSQRFDGIQCVCPLGTQWNGRRCAPPQRDCPDGQIWNGERCAPQRMCPIGQVSDGERCVPAPRCPPGQMWDGQACACLPGQQGIDGNCKCPPGFYWNGSSCEPSNGRMPTPPPQDCPPGQMCLIPECPSGQYWDGAQCVPSNGLTPPAPGDGRLRECPPGQMLRNDTCIVVDPIPPGDQQAPPADQQTPPGDQSPPAANACKAGDVAMCCRAGFTGDNVAVTCALPTAGTNRCSFPLTQVCCTPQADGNCFTPPPPPPEPTPGSCQAPGESCCGRFGNTSICAPAPSARGCPVNSVCCTEEQRNNGTCVLPEKPRPATCRDSGGQCCVKVLGNPLCVSPNEDGLCLGGATCCTPGSTASNCVPPPQQPPPPTPDIEVNVDPQCQAWAWVPIVGIVMCLAPRSDTCYNDNQCGPGTRCDGGACIAADEGRSRATSTQTGSPQPPCPEGQERRGDQCVPACSGGRIWGGEFCICPDNGRWTGSSCETVVEQPRVQPSCRKGTRWDGKKCVPIKKRPTCKSNERWDGKRCRPVSQPTSTPQAVPELAPGFSIQIGPGFGGGRGGGNRGSRGPGRISQPPRGGPN